MVTMVTNIFYMLTFLNLFVSLHICIIMCKYHHCSPNRSRDICVWTFSEYFLQKVQNNSVLMWFINMQNQCSTLRVKCPCHFSFKWYFFLQIIILFMHQLPQVNVMLDVICMGSVELRGAHQKWKNTKWKWGLFIRRIIYKFLNLFPPIT